MNIFLAIISVICGSIVGIEREKKEKPAGFRTLTLVCLGSAVFTMASVSFSRGDPSRIAAQIVSGVGFLGAGAILRGAVGVSGMTSAATIWVMAAIGMVVGAGYALAGLGVSVLILAVLTIISSLERRWLSTCKFSMVTIAFDPFGGKSMVRIEEILEDGHIAQQPLEIQTTEQGLKTMRLTYCHVHRHHRQFLTYLAALPEVREIRHDSAKENIGPGEPKANSAPRV
ncbi:MAG: MgtC/SapB family protein [Verrucomicrobiales bacterium]|nr:MgtC/SapB family protein [Verrucomicrobiales bacterium]